MGVKEPALFFGKVFHGRLFPKRNNFAYSIYYLSIPLSQRKSLPIAYNRFAALSFYERDHGDCDGSSLEAWARNILAQHGLNQANGEITIMCMPRVVGYVFNPVSFWLCHDTQGALRAVLCEVHNTFGERHTYVCAHEDQGVIKGDETLRGKKLFHVSPLLKREGHYEFRFDVQNNKFGVWINFFNADEQKQLVTSMTGTLKPMDAQSLRKAFWQYPLVTFKAITLIHWQALKLLAKGIKYISRPEQKQERISSTDNLTKM